MNQKIKVASFQEIQLMLDWALAENWNPGLNDAYAFQMIDLNGFFIGYLGAEPVSCISTVKYNSEFAFLGLYIVKPQYRGRGFGYQIWQHALHYGDQTNIGLDGVVAQQNNYKKSGFHLAHRNIRYCSHSRIENKTNPYIINALAIPFTMIADYSRDCFPCDRKAFLTSWILMNNATALVYFDETIKGYGVIRACRKGYKIGPLFADNAQIASELLRALSDVPEKKTENIYVDIPEPNTEGLLLAEQLAMEPVFETARMYTKHIPTLAVNKIFGITSLEVG